MAENEDINTEERNQYFTVRNLGKYISDDVSRKVAKAVQLKDIGLTPVGNLTARAGDVRSIYQEKNIWTGFGPVENKWSPLVSEEFNSNVDQTSTAHGWCDVINAPFQFNHHDDVRSIPFYPNLGRVYNKDIRQNFPIVVFEVGKINYPMSIGNFIRGTNSSQATNMKSFVRGDRGGRNPIKLGWMKVKGMIGAGLDFVGDKVFGKGFPHFESDLVLYRKYINEMMIELAVYLGLVSPKSKDDSSLTAATEELFDAMGSKDFDQYDGDNQMGGYAGGLETLNILRILPGGRRFGNAMGADIGAGNFDYFPFLAHKGFSISESFSNSTETHPMAQKINQMASESDSQNTAGGVTMGDNIVETLTQTAINKAKNKLKNMSGNELISATAGDARMQYPDIWSDSSFSRSYSLSFKFESPYGDTLSIFENVYIPFLILLAMAGPRQVGKSTYTSPFAVRAFSKGWFSCPMGFIESMSIERGDEKNNWTKDGLPRSIKVNLTLKDLVPNMMISMNGGVFASLHSYNLGMREYMATLGGLTIKEKHNFLDKLEQFWAIFRETGRTQFDSISIAHSLSESFVSKPFVKWKKNNMNRSPY